MNSHYEASSMVRYWKPAIISRRSLDLALNESKSFTLVYPGEGYRVSVSFVEIRGEAKAMWVRSTNWRCEHEPGGMIEINECRAFYKRLLAAGFVREGAERRVAA